MRVAFIRLAERPAFSAEAAQTISLVRAPRARHRIARRPGGAVIPLRPVAIMAARAVMPDGPGPVAT